MSVQVMSVQIRSDKVFNNLPIRQVAVVEPVVEPAILAFLEHA